MKKISSASIEDLSVENLKLSLMNYENNEKFRNDLNVKLINHLNLAKQKNKFKKEDTEAFYERVKNRDDEKKERLSELKIICKKEEARECTHQPRINKSFKSKKLRARQKISTRVNKILEDREKKRTETKNKELQKMQSEIKEFCTFTPKINKKYRYLHYSIIQYQIF